MKLEDELTGVSKILLDTAPIVYFIETNPRYLGLKDTFFFLRKERDIQVVTTPVTLTECLVFPYRNSQFRMVEVYSQLLTHGRRISFHPLKERESIVASEIRAKTNLTLSDSFQVAAALQSGCQAILTNDHALKRIDRIKTIVLDDLEP